MTTIQSCGSLNIILGPMFSGKTTRLIQIYKTHTYIGKHVEVVNYADDTRYHDSMLSTHDKIMIPCILVKSLTDIWRNPENPNYQNIHESNTILINEGQFFPDLFEIVLEMVEKEHKEVYICGLDGDFKRNTFGELLKLIPNNSDIDNLPCDLITILSNKNLSNICDILLR